MLSLCGIHLGRLLALQRGDEVSDCLRVQHEVALGDFEDAAVEAGLQNLARELGKVVEPREDVVADEAALLLEYLDCLTGVAIVQGVNDAVTA
jgi:hypothetical protein